MQHLPSCTFWAATVKSICSPARSVLCTVTFCLGMPALCSSGPVKRRPASVVRTKDSGPKKGVQGYAAVGARQQTSSHLMRLLARTAVSGAAWEEASTALQQCRQRCGRPRACLLCLQLPVSQSICRPGDREV